MVIKERLIRSLPKGNAPMENRELWDKRGSCYRLLGMPDHSVMLLLFVVWRTLCWASPLISFPEGPSTQCFRPIALYTHG